MDFASDESFQEVPAKLQEHYGIDLGLETIRKTTLFHAEQAGYFLNTNLCEAQEVKQLIAESDGSMVPIVTFDKSTDSKDLRKNRRVGWREARLCFSRDTKGVSAIFRATLGSADEAGDYWYATAKAAGMGPETSIHCVGDGAPWIKDQADRIFANQGSYLIDYYHLSEYLAAASCEIAPSNSSEWLINQQEELKNGNLYLVLQRLEDELYSKSSGGTEKIAACYRYMSKRLYQLDYLGALEQELPIGSGEIESNHRRVIQKRLKRPGAWWKLENAQAMLQLLTLRANNLWEHYWRQVSLAEEAA